MSRVLNETALRRETLTGRTNPRARSDYVIQLKASRSIPKLSATVEFRVRYIPDQSIIAPETFDGYLAHLGTGDFDSVEQVAACVLDDINNQIVPRWVQVTTVDSTLSFGAHSVMIEDRQPNWDNPSLLDRLVDF